MKATGIIRRIDDLGRLVVPKQIRELYKEIGFEPGEPFAIFIDEKENSIIFKNVNSSIKLKGSEGQP